MKTADYYIEKLSLQPHPEGGYFREVYRSDEEVHMAALPWRFEGNRSIITSIYYLLKEKDFSAFHKLNGYEIWHYYAGSPLIIYQLTEPLTYNQVILGPDPDQEHVLQHAIIAESWFAAELTDKQSFALLGCDVAPGFDFNDFQLADKTSLQQQFPEQAGIIKRLCIGN
jgi:hypothetical protein